MISNVFGHLPRPLLFSQVTYVLIYIMYPAYRSLPYYKAELYNTLQIPICDFDTLKIIILYIYNNNTEITEISLHSLLREKTLWRQLNKVNLTTVWHHIEWRV